MIVFPALDLRGGCCVRLIEGRFDRETVFSQDPSEMARRWQDQGAEYLHVVDLDGARAGEPQNLTAIRAILKAVDIPIQLGGGIRSMASIRAALDAGVQRVILGSAAVSQPELVRRACVAFGERIVVGIDARDGRVKVNGWGEDSGLSAVVLAQKMQQAGVERIIYTDIGRDGTLKGVNIAATQKLAETAGVQIIASGGVGSLADIEKLQAAASPRLEGVIIGRALYTGAVDLKAAIRVGRKGAD